MTCLKPQVVDPVILPQLCQLRPPQHVLLGFVFALAQPVKLSLWQSL